MKRLTAKENRFVQEYMKDSNASQAAIRSGYSKRSAGELGHRLLKKVEVQAALTAKTDKLGIDAEYILGSLKKVAERCMQAEPVMEFDYEEKEMVKTGEFKFDSNGANRALELLGKNKKLFTERVEVTDSTDYAGILRERRGKFKRS